MRIGTAPGLPGTGIDDELRCPDDAGPNAGAGGGLNPLSGGADGDGGADGGDDGDAVVRPADDGADDFDREDEPEADIRCISADSRLAALRA
ncbi:MAG TPA: hypothetical protein VGC42_18965, partial [Kofleriaceae bacterium]